MYFMIIIQFSTKNFINVPFDLNFIAKYKSQFPLSVTLETTYKHKVLKSRKTDCLRELNGIKNATRMNPFFHYSVLGFPKNKSQNI